MPGIDAQALITQLEGKMRRLADEFALGEINREQFQSVYEHYLGQMNLANALLADAENAAFTTVQSGETVVIKHQMMAKAKGMAVYYHPSAQTLQVLETLGDFEIPFAEIEPVLRSRAADAILKTPPEPQVRELGREYVLYITGRYSTAVMLFSHEPVIRQIATVQTMHRDFETANESRLRADSADARQLVYPFAAIVRRSIRR